MSRRLDRSLKRRPPFREPKYRILVVCEGKRTEPQYFRDLKNHLRNPRVHVETMGPAGVPRTVVEVAIHMRNEAGDEATREHDDNIRWDEVWAVFDVDDHPGLETARQLAKANGIELAVSNPCFELWALLHFTEHRSHIERKSLRKTLQKHLPGYDKALDFPKMNAGYGDAVGRAMDLDAEALRHESPGRNPTTGVYRLTEAIRTK